MKTGSRTAVALAHLALVALGAAGIRVALPVQVEPAVALYANLSGADNRYGFFAPSVSSEIRAILDTPTDTGGRTRVNLTDEFDGEARLRVGTQVDQFLRLPEEFKRVLAAMWARKALSSSAAPESVRVIVEVCDLPSMALHRDGASIEWNEIYFAEFGLLEDDLDPTRED